MSRLRVPVSLVAVFLLITMVAAVLIGGRVLHEWNAFHNASLAGQGSQIGELEARPVHLPKLNATDPCPENGRNRIGFDYGAGPVYVDLGPEGSTEWGHYWEVIYFTSPSLTGPVVVRGRDLKSDRIFVFTGDYASGALVHTDPGAGPLSQQWSELVFDAGNTRGISGSYGHFEVIQGISLGWSGCFGFQIDGPNFSETITGFEAP
jgi:hypothetical protein